MEPTTNFIKSNTDQFAHVESPIKILISDNLVEIFKKLPFENLASLALVSKSWQSLSDSDDVWKEVIKAELPFRFKVKFNMPCKAQFRAALKGSIQLILKNEKQLFYTRNKFYLFPKGLIRCLKSNASHKVKYDEIKEFIKKFNVENADAQAINRVHYLCQMAYYEVNLKSLKLLFALGADPNMLSNQSFSPSPTLIFCAMYSQELEAVKAVIDAGGDLTIKNVSGETVWDVAQRFFSQDDIQKLKGYAENRLRDF